MQQDRRIGRLLQAVLDCTDDARGLAKLVNSSLASIRSAITTDTTDVYTAIQQYEATGHLPYLGDASAAIDRAIHEAKKLPRWMEPTRTQIIEGLEIADQLIAAIHRILAPKPLPIEPAGSGRGRHSNHYVRVAATKETRS